jgi:PAS domain S-box-containing protein
MWIQQQGEFTFANEAAAEFFGVDTPEDLFGVSLRSFAPTGSERQVQRRMHDQLAGEEPSRTTVVTVRPQRGPERQARLVAFEAGDDGEESLVVTATDIGDEHEPATFEHERLRAIFENARSAVVEYVFRDGEPVVEGVNDSFETVFGYAESAVVGHPLDDLVVPDDDAARREARALNERVQRGEELHTVVERETPDGLRSFMLRSTAVDDSAETRGFSIYTVFSPRRDWEQAFEVARRQYQTLLHAAPDPVFVADIETGEIVEANEAAARLRGEPREEIVGRHQTELHPSEEAERYRELFAEHADEGGGVSGSDGEWLHVVTADGEQIPVEIRTETITLTDKTVIYGVFRDVSERAERERELHELEAFNRELVENAPVGLFRLDEEMRIVYENPRAQEIVGVPEDEDEPAALGEDIRELPSVVEAGIDDAFERLADGERISLEFEFTSIHGKRSYLQGRGVPLSRDGSFDGALVLLQDIADRRDREQWLRVVDRTLRHDLRNKLNVIRGKAETISREGSHSVRDHARTVVEQSDGIVSTADKTRIVNEIIQRRSEPETFDLTATVVRAVRSAARQFPEASITFDPPETVVVTALPRAETAVEELIENAIEHTDRDRPEVSVSLVTETDTARVEVADHGPGLPEVERRVLTGRDDIDQLNHSRGLGLWLAYWTARHSNGRLLFMENDPRGTVVALELQRAQ